jgi:hypothetical protein
MTESGLVMADGGHEIDLILRDGFRFAVGRFGAERFGLKHKVPPLRSLSLRFGRDDRVFMVYGSK